MRARNWTFICSAAAAAMTVGAAFAQDCATAPTAADGPNPFNTTASTVSVAMPAGGGCGAHTMYKCTFFTYTATNAGVHTFSLCGGSNWDTRIAVCNTCTPADGVVACNDDSCGLQSNTAANLAAGQTVKIYVGGFGAANGGAGSLIVTAPAGGGGGSGGCANAVEMVVGDNAFTNTTTLETIDLTGLCAMQFTQQIYNTNYYEFTPAESGAYRLSTCNTASFDTKIAVLNSCNLADGVAACNDDGSGCAAFTSLIPSVELTAGVAYKIAIGGYSATTPVGSGTLAITFLGGGGGSGCKSATEVFEGDNAFDTSASFETIDLTGICDPGPYGDDLMYNSAWYNFTPAKSGVFTISTCNLAPFDTRLAVMTTCNPTDGVLACNDDGPTSCANFTSRIDAVELEGGVTYKIAVGGYDAGSSGAGTLQIAPFVPCELDTATGTEVELCGEDLNGGCNNAAGGNPTEPIAIGDVIAGEFFAGGGTRDTDWYSLTITEGTEVTLSIKSSIECFAAVVGTSCGGIIGDPTVGQCPGTTSVCLAAGTYYIVALPSSFEGSPCGSPTGNAYTLAVTGVACDAEPPANDLCANATVAIEGANAFDNTFASTDVATPTCGFDGVAFTNDVWFSFTATQTGDYNLETCTGPAPFDTGIEVYDNCPDNGGSLLGCNDDGAGCAAFASSLNQAMVAGTTYLIRVAGWGGATGATDLVITFVGDAPSCGDAGIGSCCEVHPTPFCDDADCCSTVCAADAFCCTTEWDQFCVDAAIAACTGCGGGGKPPVNDECTGALPIAVGVTEFSTVGATGTTVACTKFNNPNIYKDIWFVYTADGDGECRISLCGSSYDTKIGIFEGACDGPLVGCNDDSTNECAGTLQSEVTFTPTCGTVYYISIGAWGTQEATAATGAGTANLTQLGKCGAACPGDFDGDGFVNAADLSQLLGAWGTAGGDVDGDGQTNAADLALLLGGWGACQ